MLGVVLRPSTDRTTQHNYDCLSRLASTEHAGCRPSTDKTTQHNNV